ncbi:MAG: hypothetical protein U1F76_28450 [Candidatus Competibacteraceae bacterium]
MTSEATMKKKYRNPPIEEALVEFRFVPGQEWDLTSKDISSLDRGLFERQLPVLTAEAPTDT